MINLLQTPCGRIPMGKGCRLLLSLCILKRGLWYYHLSHDEDLRTVLLTLHVPFKCWTLRKFTWRICIKLSWIDRVKLDWVPLYWEHSFMGLATWYYFLYLVQRWHRLLPLSCICCPKRSVLLSTCKHQQDDHQGDEHESSVQFSYKTVHVMTRILLALYSMLSREKSVVSSWN